MQDIFEELNKLYESDEQDNNKVSDDDWDIFITDLLTTIEKENKEIYIDKVDKIWELDNCNVLLNSITLKGEKLADFLADEVYLGDLQDLITEYINTIKGLKTDLTIEDLKDFNVDKFLEWCTAEKKEDIISFYDEDVESFVSNTYSWGDKNTYWRDCDYEVRDAEYYEDEWADWAVDDAKSDDGWWN